MSDRREVLRDLGTALTIIADLSAALRESNDVVAVVDPDRFRANEELLNKVRLSVDRGEPYEPLDPSHDWRLPEP